MKKIQFFLITILAFVVIISPLSLKAATTTVPDILRIEKPTSTIPRILSADQRKSFAVPFTQFGYGSAFRLSGSNAEATIAADVYPGFKPVAINFSLSQTPNLRNGFLTVEHQGVLIASLPLPTKQDVWRVQLPKTGLTIKDDRFVFSFRAIMNTDDEQCSAFKTRWLDVSEAEMEFEGTPEQPRSISEFFPRSLKNVTVYVGKNPAPETVAAALEIIAFAQTKAVGRPIETRLLPLDLPVVITETSYDKRVISLATGQSSRLSFASVSSTWPVLAITSPTTAWRSTLGALTDSETGALLIASDVRSESTAKSLSRAVGKVSFKDLGKSFLSLKGVGEMETTVSFSQSDFGQPIKDAVLHLTGMSSALQSGGVGRLDVYVNDKLIHSYQLSEEGAPFDRQVKIPNNTLIRDNSIRLVGYYTPPGGNCRVGLHSIVIDISNDSYITASPAQISFPEFDHLPQAFLGGFDVVIDTLDENSLTAASELIVLLQRLTPHLLPIERVHSRMPRDISRPLIAVSAKPDELSTLKAFVQPKTLVVSDAEKTTNLGIQGSFSSLQTFFENEKPALVLTHHSWPSGMRALTAYLRSKDGWYTTKGNVMVLNAAGQASFARFDPTEQVGKGTEKKLVPGLKVVRDKQYGWTAVAGFGALIVVIASLGFTYKQRRQKKKLADMETPRGFTK